MGKGDATKYSEEKLVFTKCCVPSQSGPQFQAPPSYGSGRYGFSMPDMTGRPGCRTMEMFGGSTASYLARTPRIPLFVPIFIGLETKNVLDYQGRAGSTSIVQWTLRPVISGRYGFRDLGFSGPRIPFCATGALCLWGRVTPFS